MAPSDTFIILNSGNGSGSIALAADTSGAPFVGFHLIDYAPEPTPYEVARSSSLASDGALITDYKAGNVTEVITLNIYGSTAADAFQKLRALKRWAWACRDYFTLYASRTPGTISYTPRGSPATVYAAVISAVVSETAQAGRASIENGVIRNVKIAIEREPYWRSIRPEPKFGVIGDYMQTNAGLDANPVTGKWWGIIVVDNNGAGTDLKELGGDVPALLRLEATGINDGYFQKFVCGYQSQIRDVYDGAFIQPTGPLLYEAEGMFSIDPNATKVADALASPYDAATPSALTAFNIADLAGSSYTRNERIFATATIGYRSYRLFLRMRVTASTPVALQSVLVLQTGVGQIGPAQTVGYSVDYRMYDMGVLRLPRTDPPEWNELASGWPYAESTTFRISTQITSAFSPTPPPLRVDFALLIPCDEYYITDAPTDTKTIYNGIQVPPVTGTVLGELMVPPGSGTFYYVAGDPNFENTYQATTPKVGITLTYCERFEAPRGAL